MGCRLVALIVVLDIGHGVKPGRPYDPGATNGLLREVDLARAYADHAAIILSAAGLTVHRVDSGPYSDRHRRVCNVVMTSPGLYVQCHVNAGGGRYGLVEYDSRSSAGLRAAAVLAHALTALPEASAGKTVGLSSGERGFTCISGIWPAPKMCGLIYEPGFIDTPQHAALWTAEGLQRVGRVLAAGVLDYARTLTG